MSTNVLKRSVESVTWQDCRAANTGMVVYYNSDPISEVPIREIPDDVASTVIPEPNYETGTYGLYGCDHPKIRGAFAKGKYRYLFFMTKYAGTEEDAKGKLILTGYYRINKTADVKKFHVRYLEEYACLDSDDCTALRANEVRFVSLEDAMKVDDKQLKEWGFTSKVTRQTRILLTEEQAAKVLEYLKSKDDAMEDYLYETNRLQPHDPNAEDEDDASEETEK